MASSNDGGLPSREQLMKAVESAQAAQKAQSTANDLKTKVKQIADPKQREALLKEAFDKEIEAHGHSKMAKRMQSGTWQGLGLGGGIGAATGLGLGAGLGTVIGAVTAVPTAGLGMLVGSGVGAIHGPWIKLSGKEQKFEDADPAEVADALEQEQDSQRKAELEQRVTAAVENVPAEDQPRRKPKKLEIRSQRNADSGQQDSAVAGGVSAKESSAANQKPRRKPKKLEIRSGKSGSTTSPKPDP